MTPRRSGKPCFPGIPFFSSLKSDMKNVLLRLGGLEPGRVIPCNYRPGGVNSDRKAVENV
ncbi:MAG: hypothetical protein DRH56_10770 [Deltaproteobacteria bacterium]|nr:MAG: hypothetical protein DRH56_10770 [Deltaproteobacteria bacterium]